MNHSYYKIVHYLCALFVIGACSSKEDDRSGEAVSTTPVTSSSSGGGSVGSSVGGGSTATTPTPTPVVGAGTTGIADADELRTFTGATGTYGGSIKLTISFAIDTDSYDRVDIYRAVGATAPSTCSGSAIHSFTSYTDTTYTDTGLSGAASYSYLACIIDKEGDATQVNKVESVTAKYYTMFTSSAVYSGDELATANSLCETLAADSSGTWKAIISTSSLNASSRIAVSGQIQNTNGDIMTNNGETDMFGGSDFAAAANYDENGTTRNANVWTGTKSDGTADTDHCTSWSVGDNSVQGRVGNSFAVDGAWMDSSSSTDCDTDLRIYCIDGQ